MPSRPAHDVAWKASRDVVGVFRSLLMEGELNDAAREVYEIILGALAEHDERRERAARRLRPGGD